MVMLFIHTHMHVYFFSSYILRGEMAGILVFYCCLTSYHKFDSLNQHKFSIPQFCGSEVWAYSAKFSAQSLTKPILRCLLVYTLIWSFLRRIHFLLLLFSQVFGQSQLLVVVGLSSLRFLLAVSQEYLSGPRGHLYCSWSWTLSILAAKYMPCAKLLSCHKSLWLSILPQLEKNLWILRDHVISYFSLRQSPCLKSKKCHSQCFFVHLRTCILLHIFFYW